MPLVGFATATAAAAGAGSGWLPSAWRFRIGIVSTALGASLLVLSMAANSRGALLPNLPAREHWEDDPWSLAGRTAGAAVPAVWIAIRLGQRCVSTRGIAGSGVIGLWVPLTVSAALGTTARIWDAKVHTTPLWPLSFQNAIPGLPGAESSAVGWTLAFLTLLGPSLVCSLWIRDLTSRWEWKGRPVVIAAAVGVLSFAPQAKTWWVFGDLYPYWCFAAVAGFGLAPKRRGRSSPG